MSDQTEIQKTFGLYYEIEDMFFGQGSFGKIYRAKKRSSGEIVVIKQIDIQNMDEMTLQYMFNEIEIMKKCKNKNVISLIESVSTDKYIYIVMENCQTSLDILWKEQFDYAIPERYVVYILKQIVHGFAYLHSNNIIHRDIKLENILVSCTKDQQMQIYTGQYDALYKMTFKIADFGLSKSLDNQNQLTDTYVGSPLTMAPEILEDKPYGIKADMYSLGVILYQMLFGYYPYQSNQNDMSDMQHERIKSGDAPFLHDDRSISKDFESLIKSMLQYDVTERLDWDELYQSKLIKIDFNKQIHLIDLEIQDTFGIYKKNGFGKEVESKIIEQPLSFADLEELNNLEKLNNQEEEEEEQLNNVLKKIYLWKEEEAKIQINEEEKEKQIESQAIQQIQSSDDDFEVVTFADPMAEFLGRIVRLKNQYGMLFRASQSLLVLLTQEPQLPQNQNNLYEMAKSLESLAVRVYKKIYNQLLEKHNILNIKEDYWKLMQESQQYQVVKQIILEDSKLFQVSQQQIEQRFFFGLIKWTPNDPFSNNNNYQKQINLIEEILVKLAEKYTEEIILQKIKLSIIHIMYIYFAFDERYEYPIEFDVEFKIADLKQANEKIKILKQRILRE